MTAYVLVTAESLAAVTCHQATFDGMRPVDVPCHTHRQQAAAILAAHPREATEALFAFVDWIAREHDIERCLDGCTIARKLAALRKHIAQEDGP